MLPILHIYTIFTHTKTFRMENFYNKQLNQQITLPNFSNIYLKYYVVTPQIKSLQSKKQLFCKYYLTVRALVEALMKNM